MSRQLLAAIRKEYGESASAVIAGYAKMGYSKKATQQAMGLHPQFFWSVLRRFNLEGLFIKANYNESCKPHGHGRPKGTKGYKKQTYTDMELLDRVAQFSNSRDFENHGPPSPSTVQRRFGSWSKAVQLTKLRRAA